MMIDVFQEEEGLIAYQIKSNKIDTLSTQNLMSKKREKSKIDLSTSTKPSYHF